MSHSITLREQQLISSFREKAREASRQCYHPGCVGSAISSHVLQAKGPLRDISENRKVRMLLDEDQHFGNGKYTLKECVIGKGTHVQIFRGFCATHDPFLFLPIEGQNRGVENRQGQLLHSYRTLVNEYHKICCNLDWYSLILGSSELGAIAKEPYHERRWTYSLREKHLAISKSQIESDLAGETEHFTSRCFSIPRIDFCCAICYSRATVVNKTQAEWEEFLAMPVLASNQPSAIDLLAKKCVRPFVGGNWFLIRRARTFLKRSINPKPFIPISVNIVTAFPLKDRLQIVVCTSTDSRLSGKLDLKAMTLNSEREISKFLSDVVIRNGETWFISPKLYKTWKSTGWHKKVIEQIHLFLGDHELKGAHTPFNMFGNTLPTVDSQSPGP